MDSPVVVPGGRDVRGSLDSPTGTGGDRHAESCVVACPPHPRLGGSRSDRRLQAVADALVARDVACLRIDYGPWDEGPGECRDVRNALQWAADRYATVGAFGYSFGGTTALVATAQEGGVTAVSALAPAPQVHQEVDAVAVLDDIARPVQVLYGERDDTVEWERVVERARERGFSVGGVAGDHHFVGQSDAIAERVSAFFVDTFDS